MKSQWIVVANASLTRFFERASDPLLGELKAALGDDVARRAQLANDSDYTSLGVSELEQRLRDMHAKT